MTGSPGSQGDQGFVAKVRSTLGDLGTVGIAVGVAAITAVLGALGISGDTLARLLRNQPTLVLLAFLAALVAVALGFVSPLASDTPNPRGGVSKQTAVRAWAGAFLIGAAVFTVWAVLAGAGDREQPALAITATPSAKGEPRQISVTVKADGLSLRSDDRMLLRVLSVDADPNNPPPTSAGQTATPQVGAVRDLCATTGSGLIPANARVLYLGESGPNASGASTISISVTVAQPDSEGRGRYICAHAVLSSRSLQAPPASNTSTTDTGTPSSASDSTGQDRSDERFVTSVLDLLQPTSGTPTTTVTTTPPTGTGSAPTTTETQTRTP